MDESQDLTSIQDTIQAALISVTKTCGQISAEDLGFQRQLDHQLGSALDEQAARVLALSSALLQSATSIADLKAPILEDVDDVDNNWRGVVDIIDSLLEKTDTCLDEYTGVRKRKEENSSVEQAKLKNTKTTLGNSFRNKNLVKPQLAFNVKPDNSDISPWKPLLKTKPHAIQPLENSFEMIINDYDQQQYQHPYETEISQLKYPNSVYQNNDPILYQPVDTTSATFVDTLEGVLEMLAELKTASEIAVDLEHHDTRSFVGLTSLMQISTRNRDWIVDTLKPWRQELQVLNEVFADPNIIKVFHGAFMDIVWLQRDLGLYIVGLFDTHHASRTLGYQGGSLAFLLKKFIDFDADKKYQMADWRIRPLPEEMFYYARADTHYLLFIYDNMRNELIERTNTNVPDENKLEIVLQKSKETSLIRYEKQVYNAESGKGPGGWFSLLYKTPALLSNEQFAVFKAVHEWRDKVARIDDESTGFIMPNHVIFTIAKILPMDMIALLGLLHPISFGVKSRSGELLKVIQDAKAQGKNGPSMASVFNPKQVSALPKAATPVATKTLLTAVVNETELVSEQSSFWGGAFGSSLWETPSVDTNETLRLAVPLPLLTSEIFATPENPGLADRSRSQDAELASPSPEPPSQEEPFVIKGGGKRKSEAVSEDDAATYTTGDVDTSVNEVDEMSLDPESERRKKQKNAKKAGKKERKRQKTIAKNQSTAEDEAPFDYSKAESVLSGKNKGGDRGPKKQKKPFDPYSKSENAQGGMRRLQTERPGKSHTFKN